ncbi:MAG: hypothetical protein ACOCUT_01330 [bacterium]
MHDEHVITGLILDDCTIISSLYEVIMESPMLNLIKKNSNIQAYQALDNFTENQIQIDFIITDIFRYTRKNDSPSGVLFFDEIAENKKWNNGPIDLINIPKLIITGNGMEYAKRLVAEYPLTDLLKKPPDFH